MKLWHKIFISSVVITIVGMLAFSIGMISRTHKNSLERESDRCVSELELLAQRAKESIENGENIFQTITRLSKDQKGGRKGKGHFVIFKGNTCVYKETSLDPEKIAQALQKNQDKEKAVVIAKEENHYAVAERTLDEEYTLVYVRSINWVFTNLNDNIRQFLISTLVLVAALSIMSSWIAKRITRPLEELERSAKLLNQGAAAFRLKEGPDEMGQLGAVFNSMSQAVQEREEELKREAVSRQQFIESMSHEMNTPLTSIQGYAQFLQYANCKQEQRAKALENIQKETRRMQAMQRKLMDIHSIKEDMLLVESLDTEEIIEAVEEELKPKILEKNITVVEQTELPVIEGDRLIVHILLSNFLRNSIAYSEAGSKVEIHIYADEKGRTCLQVKDHGCGIPKEHLDKVTRAFYRVDKSRSRATGGSGIGLYLCQHIVDVMGGSLKIRSQEGKGTTITVIF